MKITEKEINETKQAIELLKQNLPAMKVVLDQQNNPCANGFDSGLEKIVDGVKEVVDSAKDLWKKIKNIF